MDKKLILIISLIFYCLILAGCSNKKALYVYNWADYMSPNVLQKFEEKYKCSVVMNYFDSNESLYAKLKAGASGYDVLFPSAYMSKLMYEQGMIKSINRSELPNLKNIDLNFIKSSPDPNMTYSVPYMISYCGIAYNKEKVTNFKPSWSMFDRKDLAGRITLLNDVREVIGAALKFNGYSYNSTEPESLKKAGETVINWKKNIAKFDVDEAKRGLSSGEFFMIQAYNGDAIQLMAGNDRLAFAFPVEGTSIAQDDIVISADAKHTNLAYRFIDFLLEPENAKENMSFVSYIAPNKEAQKLMDRAVMDNPAIMPPPDIMAKCDHLVDLKEDNAKYSELWDFIKSAK